jgi:hypothetical protein
MATLNLENGVGVMTYNGLGNGFLTSPRHHAKHRQLQS